MSRRMNPMLFWLGERMARAPRNQYPTITPATFCVVVKAPGSHGDASVPYPTAARVEWIEGCLSDSLLPKGWELLGSKALRGRYTDRDIFRTKVHGECIWLS